jgi:uncharacterized protein (UPF0332 family)
MTARSLPKDLLEQAEHLANKETKRPKQASLRRAVSTAYYALFHLLSAEGSELLARNVNDRTRHRIQRWFDHGTIKATCDKFSKPVLDTRLSDLIGAPASAELQRVARNFTQLQEARHSADYDMNWNVTRTQALAYIQQARDACNAWSTIRKSAEANIFVLSLFLLKQIENPRNS